MTMAFWLGRSTYSSACTSVRSSRPGRGPISSTTTAIECGSSSRTPSRAASLISSATMTCSGSSVRSPSGYRATPSGRCETSTSASTSSWKPVTADTGTTSAQSPSSLTASSCSATRSGDTSSHLVTTTTTGVFLTFSSSRAKKRSPGPTGSPAGTQNPITSTSASVERTRLSRCSPSSVRGLCRPGVSTTISCASGRCTMPRMTRLVVCGRSLVIATLAPTRAFVRVDLPTFGRPTRQAKPERKAAGGWFTSQYSRMFRGADATDRSASRKRRQAEGAVREPGHHGATVLAMATSPKFRPTARLIVLDPADRVLLFSARDPRGKVWFTPGGGVHRGEALTAAAVRELAEETGHVRAEADLGPVVAATAGLWTGDGLLFFGV